MPKSNGVFYTYLWLREDGTPYYVGKGTTDRAFIKHRVGNPPSKDRIITQEWPSEQDAFLAEKFLILYYGREDLGDGKLLNLTDGGEGAVHSSETLKKISDTLKRNGIKPPSRKGHVKSEEEKKRLSVALKGHKGYTPSEEQKSIHSAFMKGKTYHKGFIHSEESRVKMSESAKKRAPRTRAKGGMYA